MNILKTHIILLISLLTTPLYGAVTMDVRPATTYQTVEGIGGGIVYYLDWIAKHRNCEAIYDTVYNGLGLTGLRIGNWAQEPDADLTFDSLIVAAGKKRLGDNFFVDMTSWSAPASLKSNGKMEATGGKGNVSLKKEFGGFVYDKFGQWWKRSLEQYRRVGIYPDYVSLQNEPDCNPDYYGMELNPDESNPNVASYAKALSAAAKQINQLQNPPVIIGPEVLGIGWNRVQDYLTPADKKLLGGYSFHYYHSGLNDHDAIDKRYAYPDDFKDAMSGLYNTYGKENKPLFMTENSPLRDPVEMDPIYTAWFMNLAFTVNHVSSYLHWNLIWGDEGDACINIDTVFVNGKYQKFKDGYRVNGDYHALRHYSKFVKRGWKMLYATTSDADVLITAFKSPSDDAYAVILVNKSRFGKSIECSFNPAQCTQTVIQTDVMKKSWSQVLGTYDNLKELNLPGNSITTISYNPRPATLVFDNLREMAWNNEKAWNPQRVPSADDTVSVKRGTLNTMGLSQRAPFSIEKGAVIAMAGENRLGLFVSGGGSLRSNTTTSMVADTIIVDDQTTIQVVSKDTTANMSLKGVLVGSDIINKIGTDTLSLYADASSYTGRWVISDGVFRVCDEYALGENGVDVILGTMQLNCDAQTRSLYVGGDASLELNGTLVVQSVRLGADTLFGGTYTSADYPDFLKGEGLLVVDRPRPQLVKSSYSDSVQSFYVGDSIVPLVYHWENADSVSVDWDPNQPQGISVDMDTVFSSVTISGKSDTVGTFAYCVSTVGEYGPVARDSGALVFQPAPEGLKSVNVPAEHVRVLFQDGHISIFADATVAGECNMLLADMSGRVLAANSTELIHGENVVEIGAIPMGTYLLQIQGKNINETFKVVFE